MGWPCHWLASKRTFCKLNAIGLNGYELCSLSFRFCWICEFQHLDMLVYGDFSVNPGYEGAFGRSGWPAFGFFFLFWFTLNPPIMEVLSLKW